MTSSGKRADSSHISDAVHRLQERGLLKQSTNLTSMIAQYQEAPFKAYAGIDPTAPSLHLGHLIPFFVLTHLRLAGMDVVALVGGATALIGDPTGKTKARKSLSPAAVAYNANAITRQTESMMKRALQLAIKHLGAQGSAHSGALLLMNNSSWLTNLNFLDFLSGTGGQVRINKMLARESVAKRLESGAGMSFLEFCYPLIQAHDFKHLYESHNVQLQIGGSDQWGNICEGIDMIGKSDQNSNNASGITTPLLLDERGNKFGKSEGNALWIDQNMVSSFSLYQSLIKVPDKIVIQMLKQLTFLPLATINELESAGFSKRGPQNALARELLVMLHGEKAYEEAESLAMSIYSPKNILDSSKLLSGFRNDKEHYTALLCSDLTTGMTISQLCLKVGWSPDKIAEVMGKKAAKINRKRSEDREIREDDWLDNRVMVLQMGDSHLAVVERCP